MQQGSTGRVAARVAAIVAATVAGLALAVPAWAHVEVSADNAQAGARNVTVTFKGEAESDSAGILSERVVLPAGISPGDVRLAKGPEGWTLTATSDGFTVTGPALAPGTDAEWSVVVAQLPANATELAFKTIETYTDGKVSRWIEIPTPGAEKPNQPAPMLKLAPVAAPAPTTAAPSTPAATSAPATSAPAPVAPEEEGSSTGVLIAVGVLALAAVGAVLVIWRRRSTARSGE